MDRIAIVSDTHGKGVVDLANILKEMDLDRLIFLGDLYEDGETLKRITGLRTVNVLGNNEYLLQSSLPSEKIIEIGAKKVFACHGHDYGVKANLTSLSYRAEELEADICLFGHSHIYTNEKINGIHYFNPGSPSYPRSFDRLKSFGLMLMGEKISFERIIL